MNPPLLIPKGPGGTLLRVLFLSWCLLASAPAEAPRTQDQAIGGELPLPRWTEQELAGFRDAQGLQGLLPEVSSRVSDINELLHTPPTGPRMEQTFDPKKYELAPRLHPDDMGLFLPESTLSLSREHFPPKHLPTLLTAVREVIPEFLALAAQSTPDEYLIDPGSMIHEVQKNGIQQFLNFHAKNADIKLYVLILPHDREIPPAANLGDIASGGLLHTKSCLLVYPVGEPWRARVFMSQSIFAQASTAFLSETLQACLGEAMQSSDEYDQLHRYAVHLSTRLFWLQNALSPQARSSDGPLAEITGESPVVPRFQFPPLLAGCVFLMLLIVSIVLAISKVRRAWQRRELSRIWILPEPETTPRLGGAFTGGGGGSILYGSSHN